jgi:hypothetical protein
MSLFDSFIQNIEKNLKSKGCSEIEIAEKISKIKKRNENEDCLKEIDFSCDDDDWDDVEFVANTDNELSVIEQMKPDDANDLKDVTNEDMTIEERLKVLSEYYKDKNVFDDDEMVAENNLKGAYGRTLLHDAVLEEDVEEIEKLIEEGASTLARDNSGATPYQLAVLEGKEKSLKKLKKLGITT